MIHCHVLGAEPTQTFTFSAAATMLSRTVLHAGAWNQDHIQLGNLPYGNRKYDHCPKSCRIL